MLKLSPKTFFVGTQVNARQIAGVAVRGSAHGRALRLASILGVSALVAVASTVATSPPAAYATTYPTWADVLAARQSTAATKAATTQINGLISSLNSQLKSAQADAAAKGVAAATAQQNYFAGETAQAALQAQVTAASAKAAKSHQQVAEYVAQLARGVGDGGSDGTTIQLLLNGQSAGQLLNDLGAVGQISQRENDIYTVALSDQKSAKELTAQATKAAGILEAQKKAAAAAEAAATAAATKLQTTLATQTKRQKSLTLELAALTTKLNMTESQYAAGVAAEPHVAAGGGVTQAGVVDSQGWALPTVGVITSPWGYRDDPAANYSWQMHYGDDIADGCLQPIYAAHSGTITYAGVYGDIGNYIIITDGGAGDYSTAYGHIANGETFVHIGEHVAGGQNIARTGSTGTSTGCHLYFQVMEGGKPVNPAPFMQARGIILGQG
jgi:murein DD-endopeptidase MepM/ murein hydrolase activator NlpD